SITSGGSCMRLNREAEIAVNVLLACASRPAETVQTRDVADASGTTKDYAAHIVARLVREGLLSSIRGRHGGLRLAKAPGEIRIGAIMRLMQSAAPRKRGRPRKQQSAFDVVMRAAADSFLATLDDFSLADLAGGVGTGRMVCLTCELKAAVQ